MTVQVTEVMRLERVRRDRWRYWPTGQLVMRTAERVCLAMYMDGRLVEVHGPVRR